jgi:hypothetical protein
MVLRTSSFYNVMYYFPTCKPHGFTVSFAEFSSPPVALFVADVAELSCEVTKTGRCLFIEANGEVYNVCLASLS